MFASRRYAICSFREVKEKIKAAKKAATALKGAVPPGGANIPKVQKTSSFNARGGSKR